MPFRALLVCTIVCAVLPWVPSLLAAQVSPIQVEINGGVALPVEEFAGPGGLEGEAQRGPSFGVHFALTQRHVSWYLGFSEHRSGCGGVGCSGDFISTAWDLGVRLNLASGPVVPWLRVGTTSVITKAELTDPAVDPLPGTPPPTFAAESGRVWGLEAGAGIMVRVTERLGLSPGLRYTKVDPSFSDPDVGGIGIRMWVLDLGLIVGF